MKISQREARALRKRVKELEDQRRQERATWSRTFPPGSVHLASVSMVKDSRAYGRLEASCMLGKVLVAKLDGDALHVYAV